MINDKSANLTPSLDSVQTLINHHLDSVDSEAFGVFRDDFTFGKMLRSKLILSIAPQSEFSVNLCAIVELIHFASLLHDDVIDSSIMRRGKASINAKHGDKNAIMLGDILYSKAFFEVSKISIELSQIISNCVFKLSIGELEDVSLGASFNDSESKYLRMIEYKTAALIEASAECAGILRGYSGEKYRIYGNSLGIAFQIIDDLLDIISDDKTLGKAAFSDFKEGKTTLPYIYLYRELNVGDKERLLSYFREDLSLEQRGWIMEKMSEFDIINKVRNIALGYGKKALDVLESGDERLSEIMKNMIFREF